MKAIDYQNEYENQEFGLSYGFGFQVMNVQMGISIRRGTFKFTTGAGSRKCDA